MAELRATMPARELDAWALYWQEEPWGAVRDNLHAGMIASTVINTAMAYRGHRGKPVAPHQFMIVGASEHEAKAQGAKDALVAFFRMIGKSARKGKK